MKRDIRSQPFSWTTKDAWEKIEQIPFRQQMACKMIYVALSIVSKKQQNTNCLDVYKFDIARYASLNEKTVQRHLPTLEKLGIIKIEPQDRESNGKFKKCRIWLYDYNQTVGQFEESLDPNFLTTFSEVSDSKKQINKERKKQNNTPPNPQRGQESFDQFWKEYPKKKNKGQAEKAWKKIKNPVETCNLIIKALEWQKVSDEWKKDGGQFIPHPSTYLNAKAWLDEVRSLEISAQERYDQHFNPTT